ncbi:ATP-binding protein [Funiculus sociatus GB2-A5]|uniref:ATP-binding protein n=1 Tax=Funiculus sociatus GB2-A5 TaxID=2933946 RepID=A0ABV0JSW4_9CYAN|nr:MULTISPECIES: ATP-binding protein [unclassified Trichocoleus]MBD1908156.1 AAA family ATPase [Trichocoleus sp. FACHB-832]MBD2062013.1 AAA family ATPase [Trichocoleus sp. FACHB-6]
MKSIVHGASGLLQLTHAEIKRKISNQKLFGLDELEKYLFRFCKTMLTADDSLISQFSIYNLTPSVLLYGPPNTGKTTLCYLLFEQLKQEVTNEINFYTVDVGRMLDPALGQSSRNLEQIFQDLQKTCSDGSSVFLLLDELDAFCMSRSRAQEHDAVRRAMTTLMLELDKLQPSTSRHFFVFGITNVPNLVDTAVVRRFSLKHFVDSSLSWDDFKAYLSYLNKPIKYNPQEEDLHKLYNIYKHRAYTGGDIKALYKVLLIDIVCADRDISITDRLFDLFENGFSSREHLAQKFKELCNG